MRVDGLQERLAETANSITFNTDEVEAFASTGKLSVVEVLPQDCLERVTSMCERLFRMPLPLTRHIRDPDWNNVDKVTLFRKPTRIRERSHKMSWLSPNLVTVAGWADSMVHKLGKVLAAVGQDEAGEKLAQYESNRAVINRLNGLPGREAVVGLHTDPEEEHGVNTVLALGRPGIDLISGRIIASNTLNVYACQDLSEILGIDQPVHGFSADSTRMSLVFTAFEG